MIQKGGKRFPFTKLLGLIDAMPCCWKQKLKAKYTEDNDSQRCNMVPLPPAKEIAVKHALCVFEQEKV